MRPRAHPGAVRVVAPARLHLGFLDLNGGLGRMFGSIGLAVDVPRTELVLRRSRTYKGEGPDHARAIATLRRFADVFSLGGAYEVKIASAIPSHAGLGSGTQLALAAGAALMTLEGIEHSPSRLGEIVDRGARSAIGMAAFEHGGFIVDGGRGARDQAPPILVRTHFPDDWRALLVIDARTAGVHGEAEAQAFAALPPLSDAAAANVCRLVLMQLVPGLMETDIDAFGNALTEIQKIVGNHFAGAQGGSPWTSPAVGRVVEALRAAGAYGIGQSSWGPTGFAFAPSQEIAGRLYDSSIGLARAEGLEILVAGGRNRGASVEKIVST
ncbi:MAG: GHMP kinase [Hyphomicrobium sp.]|uniref:beta-ribofuranosylaminobenzene 5'-phosphate synthase family protein n=1 Tax=Hyphomicrobium sp. TaxID=82 RepID=UPI00132CB488|nr:beta-ribofuranosylaminobenzene 5'-phosphate synthase family protein [Hyphomicrobium sp.]KAB2940507.1 MAG: GHMP kinase [Hyphomicrobium sp.]MBZ0210865.1 GHMP kinase [Hyphomicrobium sp.]